MVVSVVWVVGVVVVPVVLVAVDSLTVVPVDVLGTVRKYDKHTINTKTHN